MKRHGQSGFTLIEMLVSLTVLLLASGGLAGLLVQNSRLNRSQQISTEVQGNARNCLELVVARLRSAGWDPMNAGIATVATDPNLGDSVSQIEIFADLDEDGLTTSVNEQMTIRHTGLQVQWRRTGDPDDVFEILATNISNDADGDGTIEPMFQPDDPSNPTRVTVQITAESPLPDPTTGQVVRYTVRSDVTLRKSL